MVDVSGNSVKHVTRQPRAALTVPLEPADEARLLAWERKPAHGRAARDIAAGDVVPGAVPPRVPRRRATPAGNRHLVATLAAAPVGTGRADRARSQQRASCVSMVGGYDYAQEPVQPRAPGAPPDRLGDEAVHLRDRDRPRHERAHHQVRRAR